MLQETTMKTTLTQRIFSATVVAAFLLLSTTSFAALNAYLTLKGSNGKSYTCTADASGQFSFKDVQPGTYKLVWVLPKGDGEPTGACTIQISSFSWGATNTSSVGNGGGMGAGKSTVTTTTTTTETTTTLDQAGKSTPVTRSNISNNRSSGAGAGKVSVQDLHFTCDASKLKSSVEPGGMYETIILEDVMVSSVSSPSGKVSAASWDLAKGKN